MQRRAAAGGTPARSRICPYRRRRSEKLLRHHSKDTTPRHGRGEGDRRSTAGTDRAFLYRGVRDDDRKSTPEEGTPQGAVVSPLLSTLYLDPLASLMAAAGYEMVRSAADFVVIC